jgi:hypothetical protein
MLLRISLIVVIVAGLATAAISHFKVAVKIQTLDTDLKDTQTKLDASQTAERNAKTEASKTKKDLELTKKELATATNNLIVMTAKKDEQEQRANKHAAELEKALTERNEGRQELAKWEALGVKAEDVAATLIEKKKIEGERDAFAAEKEVLVRNNRSLQNELDKIRTPDKKVAMRPGLHGKVIAVDPKWQFVVLDIGRSQGAEERGEMVVSREGKLVAKVRLTTVDQNRSVANIIPEWKQADVVDGDQVMYFSE